MVEQNPMNMARYHKVNWPDVGPKILRLIDDGVEKKYACQRYGVTVFQFTRAKDHEFYMDREIKWKPSRAWVQ